MLWSSNAALMALNKEFDYRIDPYEGTHENEAALSGLKPVAAYTAGKDKNSVRIEENVPLQALQRQYPCLHGIGFMPHPNAGGEDVRPVGTCLDHRAGTTCHGLADTAPEHLLLKIPTGTVNIDWSVENATTGALQQPTLTITRVTEDNNTEVVAREPIRYLRKLLPSLQSVKAGNLKDTYQVV